MKRINADDCIRWVKSQKGIKLLPYQEAMLRAFCNDEEVLCARGIGRSFVAKLLGLYVAHMYDKNDQTVPVDIVITWNEALQNKVIPESLIASFNGNLVF